MTSSELAGALFSARLEQQLSQEQVATRMGYSQAALSMLELREGSARSTPTEESMRRTEP